MAKDELAKRCREAQSELDKVRTRLREAKSRASVFDEAITLLDGAYESDTIHRKLEDKIRKEKASINNLRESVIDLEGRIAAFEETIKLFDVDAIDQPTDLRPNTDLFRVREILQKAKRPLDLGTLLTELGKEDSTGNRNSLRNSLSRYTKQNRIFVKVAQNTFDLVESESRTQKEHELFPGTDKNETRHTD